MLYPVESRLMDTANQYYIYVFVDPWVQIPVGYDTGRNVRGAEESARDGAVQRDLEDDSLPANDEGSD